MPQALSALTSRELEIFNLLLNGVSPKEIAYELNVNYKTVDVHRSNLYRKLCVHSIQELVVKYSSCQIKTDSASSGESAMLVPSENRPAKGRRLKIFVLVGIAIAALSLIGYFFIKSPAKKNVPVFIESVAESEGNWDKWVHSKSTASLDYSVRDGVCTITVSGTAEPDNRYRYYTQAQYYYTSEANKTYTYVFEAWTQSGTRHVNMVYYWDFADDMTLTVRNIEIGPARKTYTIKGTKLPKGGLRYLGFECADQLGTFYVKILEIKEYDPAAL